VNFVWSCPGRDETGENHSDHANAKFDEIYQRGGIYNFMSHPQWLDYGEDAFYERHLAHIARRADVWYVPMGPLYAYRSLHGKAEIHAVAAAGSHAKFEISCPLDREIYNGSITLEFTAPAGSAVLANGRTLRDKGAEVADRWDEESFRRAVDRIYVTVHPNTTLEFQ
jgi:hypothetical protein